MVWCIAWMVLLKLGLGSLLFSFLLHRLFGVPAFIIFYTLLSPLYILTMNQWNSISSILFSIMVDAYFRSEIPWLQVCYKSFSVVSQLWRDTDHVGLRNGFANLMLSSFDCFFPSQSTETLNLRWPLEASGSMPDCLLMARWYPGGMHAIWRTVTSGIGRRIRGKVP